MISLTLVWSWRLECHIQSPDIGANLDKKKVLAFCLMADFQPKVRMIVEV